MHLLIPRPSLFVSDGAGSAILSHHGSDNVVTQLYRFMCSIEDINCKLLDINEKNSNEEIHSHILRFINHAIGSLHDLSMKHMHPFFCL
jgi:hypothetical protein